MFRLLRLLIGKAFSEVPYKILGTPPLLFHNAQLSVSVQFCHSLAAAVGSFSPVSMASFAAEVNRQAVSVAQTAQRTSKYVVLFQRIAVTVAPAEPTAAAQDLHPTAAAMPAAPKQPRQASAPAPSPIWKCSMPPTMKYSAANAQIMTALHIVFLI